MNQNTVEPQEILYRGITIHPIMWKETENRPSSAAFKQSSPLSVDRDGNRDFNEIKHSLVTNIKASLKAIAYFKAKICFDKDMFLRADPNPKNIKNPYHALISDSKDFQGVGKQNARFLSKTCKIELINQNNF